MTYKNIGKTGIIPNRIKRSGGHAGKAGLSCLAVLLFLSVFLSAFMNQAPLRVFAEETEEAVGDESAVYENRPGASAPEAARGRADGLVRNEDGILQYFFEDGTCAMMQWVKIGRDLYFFDYTTGAVTGLQTVNSHSYYFDKDCHCVFGLVPMGDDWFFFTPAIGMNHGLVSIEGKTDIYWFGENGAMFKDGWLEIDGRQYYFDEDGRMHFGLLTLENSTQDESLGDTVTYGFDTNGVKSYGWLLIEDEWYYFNPNQDGAMSRNEWRERGEQRCYLKDDGTIARGERLRIGSLDYEFTPEGEYRALWLTGIWYNRIYLLAFVLSTLCIWLGNREKDKRKAMISGILAVSVLVIVATVRSMSVGDDIASYVQQLYDRLQLMNNNPFTMFRRFYYMEPGYLLTMYVGSVVFHTPRFALFVMSLLTNAFICAGIYEQHTRRGRWFAWLVWCFLFYCRTMNIMRQYVGVAIIYYMFAGRKEIPLKKAALLILLACSFHYSCIFGIGAYALYRFSASPGVKPSVKKTVAMLTLLIPEILVYGIGFAATKLHEWDLLPPKYRLMMLGRGNTDILAPDYDGFIAVLFGMSLFVAALVTMTVQSGKKTVKLERQSRLLLYMGALDAMYALFNNVINYRLQCFVSIFRLDYYTAFLEMRLPLKWRRTAAAITVVVLFLLWYYQYVYTREGTVCPYLFMWEQG